MTGISSLGGNALVRTMPPAAPTPSPGPAPSGSGADPASVDPAGEQGDGPRPPKAQPSPFGLPSFDRLITEGDELIRLHPRDPNIRVNGQMAPAEERAEAGEERSSAARIAVLVGIGGGAVQNAIDVARLIKKYPEALRAGRFDPSLGRLGRLPTAVALTAMTRPDSRIIDPVAPRVASAASVGKSFTRFDELAMKSSVLLGASLAGIQIASSIPNLVDALSKDGPWYENLALSTSGRAGMLQLGGGLLGASLFATALRQTAGNGATGVVPRILEAAKAPIMARPLFAQIGMATGMVVMANELGYLDFLNKGEERSVGTVLQDAARRTPVINDSEFRTAALLTAGGIVGFKTHRAIAAAGGMSGIGKGHVIGGAVVAGLLGAQLLGGLRGLDKPD